MYSEFNQFRYLLFPGKHPLQEWRSYYIETYHLWRSVWTATFQELDGDGTLFSDDFCRQSIIGSIFKGSRCIGIGMFQLLDFSLPMARHDSWFKAWSDSAVENLLKDGNQVLVGNNVTVDPEFRGDLGNGIRLRNIILGLMSKTLLLTGADVMAGMARKNRGVHTASYLAGATHLEVGQLHGVEIDYVAFYKKHIEEDTQFELAVENLWNNRTSYLTPENLLTKTPHIRRVA